MKARRRMMLGGDLEAGAADAAASSRSSSSSSSSLTPYEKEVAAIIMPAERRGITPSLRQRPPSPQEEAQAGNVLGQPAARRALRRPDLSGVPTPASIAIPPRGRAAEKASRARPRSSSSPEYTYDDMMRDLYATGYMPGRPPTPENTTAAVAARSRSPSPDLREVLGADFLRHHIHRTEDGDLEKNAIETARSRQGKGSISRNDLISLDRKGRKQLYSELSRRKSELSPGVPIKIGPFQSSSVAAAPQTGAVIGRKAGKKRYIYVTGGKNGKVKHLSGYTSE